jgi:hypothetical protein
MALSSCSAAPFCSVGRSLARFENNHFPLVPVTVVADDGLNIISFVFIVALQKIISGGGGVFAPTSRSFVPQTARPAREAAGHATVRRRIHTVEEEFTP